MLRVLQLITFVAIASFGSAAQAIQFEEGVHYHILDAPRTESASILEFFSLYCISCYHHQPFNKMIENEWPGVLTKYHVSGLAPRDLGPSVQRAWAAAQLLNVDDKFATAVFNKNFAERQQVETEAAIQKVFSDIGVSSGTLELTLQSFQVRSLANRMAQAERRYKISGTPTYIVNGRYVMDNRAFRNSSDFFADYLALAEYLLEKP